MISAHFRPRKIPSIFTSPRYLTNLFNCQSVVLGVTHDMAASMHLKQVPWNACKLLIASLAQRSLFRGQFFSLGNAGRIRDLKMNCSISSPTYTLLENCL